MTTPARDLGDSELWFLSLERSRSRRAAAARNGEFLVGPKKASLAALVAVAVPPAAGTIAAIGAVAPSTAAAKAPGVLKRGSRGAAVARMQSALGLVPDGVYGPATAQAVKRFQRAHGLTADGIAGPVTLGALGVR
ncbi:MAG TPA: peptidoglycan-binding domain-containing protein, partial [Solirubrobacteraceae bacterium]